MYRLLYRELIDGEWVQQLETLTAQSDEDAVRCAKEIIKGRVTKEECLFNRLIFGEGIT